MKDPCDPRHSRIDPTANEHGSSIEAGPRIRLPQNVADKERKKTEREQKQAKKSTDAATNKKKARKTKFKKKGGKKL